MNAAKLLFIALLSCWAVTPGADAQGRRGDADAVYQGRLAGALRPLRSIEDEIVPRMKMRGAQYIGAEFDPEVNRYRLKFMRSGQVIWVDVEGRTGAVVGRAGD